MTFAEPDPTWRSLYRIGGIAAWLFVAMVLVPVVLLFSAPVPPIEGGALLEYIADNKAVYLIQLVCFVGLAIPALVVFTAAAVALSTVWKVCAVIGGLFGVSSEVVALAVGSSPQSLHGGLIVLSDAYQAAGSHAERADLVIAADGLIAATNAMPWAGILTAAAILILSLGLWRGDHGRALAVVGVVTGVLGVVSEVSRPLIGPAYLVYGLLLPTWFGWVGLRLFRLTREAGAVVTAAR